MDQSIAVWLTHPQQGSRMALQLDWLNADSWGFDTEASLSRPLNLTPQPRRKNTLTLGVESQIKQCVFIRL